MEARGHLDAEWCESNAGDGNGCVRKAGESRNRRPQLVCNGPITPLEGEPPVSAPVSQMTVDQVMHALDNSTPYPVELDQAVLRFMAERLLEMTDMHKRPDHEVWQPEEELPIGPEPQSPEMLW